MSFLHIHRNTLHQKHKYKSHLERSKDTKVFLLIYMEGCGPCNAVRPEWAKLKHHKIPDNVMVVDVDKDYIGDMTMIGQDPEGFPTIRMITNSGEHVEEYPNNKHRTYHNFAEWIDSHSKSKSHTNSSSRKETNHKHKKGGSTKRKRLNHRKIRNQRKQKTRRSY
jgi:hypothetical protein